MSVAFKKKVSKHKHLSSEVLDAKEVKPNRPPYRGIHATDIIIDSSLTLAETIMASEGAQGTSFPTDPIHGRVFVRTDEDIAYRYHDVFGWLPLDYAIVSRITPTLATRSKPTYKKDGSVYNTNSPSYVEITELREEFLPLSEFKHHLFALSCQMRHTTGGGNFCYIKVTYLINDANETLIQQWTENSMAWVTKSWNGNVYSGKNEKLTIKWYISNEPSGVATAEMKDAKHETRGIEYREDIA